MIQNPPLTYKIIEKKLKCLLLFFCLIQRNFSTSAALSSLWADQESRVVFAFSGLQSFKIMVSGFDKCKKLAL